MDQERGRDGAATDAAVLAETILRGKRDGETREQYERALTDAFESLKRRQISIEFPGPAHESPAQGSSVSTDLPAPALTTPLVPSTTPDNIQNAFQTLSRIGATSASAPKQKQYTKRSGVAKGLGEDFEVKMLTLVFLRLLEAGYEFQLASNMAAGGQFDDIVIKYRKHSNDTWKCACLQLRHKDNEKIQLTELLGPKDSHSLIKLSASFVSVESSLNKELDSFDERQIILFTNANLDDNLVDVSESDPLLSTGGKVVSFKADGEVYKGLCDWVDFKETLTELHSQVKGVSDDEVETRVKDALETVQYQNKAVVSWKDDLFRNPRLSKLNDLLKNLQNVGDKETYFSFLAELQVYTDQAQGSKLDSMIKETLTQVWSSDENSVSAMFLELQTKMKSWWQNERVYLTHDAPLWFDVVEAQTKALSKSTIDRLTMSFAAFEETCLQNSETSSKTPIDAFSENCLQVSNPSIKICDFASASGILHVRVESRTAASSLKMHQALAKFGAWNLNALHVNMKALLDRENDVFSAWATRWCPVLVVECDDEIEQKQAARISERIQKMVGKKEQDENKMFVLIAPETHTLSVQLYHADSYTRFNDNVVWDYLTDKAKKYFLSTHVAFNGVKSQLTLEELVGGDKGFVNKAGLDVVSQLLTGDVHCGRVLDEDNEFFVTRRLKESADGVPFVVNSVSDVPRKVVLIVAEPGMGKSTLLTHLSKSAKEKDSTAFILHIKLNDCVQYLKAIDVDHLSKATVMTFLEQSALSAGDSLGKLLLRTLEHKLVIFMDGVDEVCPHYEKQVFTILGIVKDMKFCQLWVASRPVFKTKLEDKLKVKMLCLVPFSEEDQKDFFKKMWMKNVPDPEICSEATENLLNWLSESLGKDNPILGVPLMSVMIAETFHEQMFSVNHAEGVFKKKERLDVFSLYKSFIKKKFDLYCKEKKKTQNRDLAANKYDEETLIKRIFQNHRLAALRVIFTQKDINGMQFEGKKKLNKHLTTYLGEVSDGREKIGIIVEVSEGKPKFVHRSFAEYFSASLLADNFGTNKEIIERITFDPSRKLVSEMFHRSLAEKHPLHVAVLNRDLKTTKSMLSAQPQSSDVNALDEGGRTPVHLAVLLSATDPHPDCISILKYLIEDHSARLDIADEVLGWTPWRYAERSGAWAALQVIVENGGHIMKSQEDWPTPDASLMLDAARRASVLVVRYLVETRRGPLASVGRRGESMIHTAAQGGNVEVLEYLRTKGLALDVGDKKQNTALWYASPVALHYLLQRGLELETVNKRGWTALQDAAQNGDSDAMTAFLEENASFDVSAKTPKSRRNAYLLFAAFSGDLESVKKLVENSASVKHRDSKKHTAAWIAIQREHFEVARWLLQRDTNERDSLLPNACRHGDLEIVSFLLSENADIEAKSGWTEMTPLMEALKAGHLDVAKMLLEKEANVKRADNEGRTPLHLASEWGSNEVAALLIEHGADVNVADNEGRTPLHRASGGSNEVAALLIEHGADVNVADNEGRTPLHRALEWGSNEVAALLIEHGADVNVADNEGRTPLHRASEWGRNEVAALLIEHGADVNVADNEGRTPLHRALEWGSNEVAALLIEHGADVNVADNEGRTPLHRASGGSNEVAALLIEHGADVNVADNEGRTPLHRASGGSNEVAALLIEHGADVNVADNEGRTPLHRALEWRSNEVAALLIEHGADVNVADNEGRTPLHRASGGSNEVAALLIEHGADVNVADNEGRTPLHRALEWRSNEVAALLIEHGADVNVADNEGRTPLHRALEWRSNEVAALLIEHGADVNVADNEGRTPLHRALDWGSNEVAALLIEHGADVNVADNEGRTPLHRALDWGSNEVAALLIEHGADVNVADNEGRTPLHRALEWRSNEVAALLIEHGADVNAHDKQGRTPLHRASQRGSNEVAALLIEHGADVNVADNEGRTPLHRALEWRSNEVAALLIEHGADVNVADNEGRTPLHRALDWGSNEVAALLIEHGADVNVADNEGHTPLHRALDWGSNEVAALLIEHGADVNAHDKQGRTPLHRASQRGSNEVAALLIEHGADVNAHDKQGRTPLALATVHQRAGMVDVLKKAGADS